MSPNLPITAPAPAAAGGQVSSAAVFLVLRRMRVPLIVLITIFSFSVLGLALIPGTSPSGEWRMGLFDAFYFMTYTATTIGYGEIPEAFNAAQRMWVTVTIFVTVIGWAYAIGTLLALLQDHGFRQELAVQRFRRKVHRIGPSFWLMAGHGETGELLGRWLDRLGHSFVVIDIDPDRVDVLDLGSYISEVPGITADARDPRVLEDAGLRNPRCEGVLCLTDDDEANLAITMAASVLRPDLQVITRCTTPSIIERMRVFGTPTIINPFDRFGDHFSIALRAPATEQLEQWLTGAPGIPLPGRPEALRLGRWIVCGYGRFGKEMTRDLHLDAIDVVVIDREPDADQPWIVRGDGTEPELLERVGIHDAVGFVAGTGNDITNLSLVALAKRINPDLFVIARQNQPVNKELFDAVSVDLLMVPATVVATEALAHIGAPMLWEFLHQVSRQDDEWSNRVIDKLVERSGEGSPELWQVALTAEDAPAVVRRMPADGVAVSDLLRDPQDRDQHLGVVALMVQRGSSTVLAPEDDEVLLPGDTILLAGPGVMRRAMETTLELDSAAAYVLTGHTLPSGWVWRALSRSR